MKYNEFANRKEHTDVAVLYDFIHDTSYYILPIKPSAKISDEVYD